MNQHQTQLKKNHSSLYDELLWKNVELVYYKSCKYFLDKKDYKNYKLVMNQFMEMFELTNQKRKMNPLETKKYFPGQGVKKKIMFIGLNPSVRTKEKDVTKSYFWTYFSRFLDEAEITEKDLYFTNIWKFQTTKNRQLTDDEVYEGWKSLRYEIELVNPKVIVPMGSQVRNVFGVGLYEETLYKNYPVYGMHHPSYVRQRKNERENYIKHLKIIKKKL